VAANELNTLLRAGIEAARAGRRTEARQLLRQVLERDARNESAWFWLASVAESVRERAICLERVVQINPSNQRAAQELAKVKASLAQEKSGTGTSPAVPTAAAPAAIPAPRTPDRDLSDLREPAAPSPTLAERTAAPASSARPARRQRSVERYGSTTAPLKKVREGGYLSTRSGLLIALFTILGGGGILIALATIPNLRNLPPPPTEGATATRRPTLSFVAQQQTIDAARLTAAPTVPIVISIPTRVPLVAATWTPFPSDTPPPSPTPTTTPYPLSNLAVVYAGEGRSRDNIGIYTTRADGKGTEQLLVKRPERSFDVAVTADGKQIAFITVVDGKEQLALADANGENVRTITKFNGKYTRTPAWSPDGRSLVVVSNQTGTDEIYLVTADGSNMKQLTSDKVNNRDPGWSPDGKLIVFASDPSGRGSYQIFTMDVQGKNRKQLTESQNSNYSPSFSPDGTKIVFISSRDRNANVYLMSADGDDEQLLTLDDGNAENRDPSFSPDGRWIVFSSTRDGIYNIFVMATDGTQVQKITNNQQNVSIGPRFQPTR
jgi:TolB protein